MQVRIQLIRDDGSVVVDLSGNATAPLVWRMPVPAGHLIAEDGAHIAALLYKPYVLYKIADALAEALTE